MGSRKGAAVSMQSFRIVLVVAVLVPGAFEARSAPAGKRPLSHRDYDAWRDISAPVLSRDGRLLAYSYMPQDGDGDLVIRSLKTGKERRISVGDIPAPTNDNDDETGGDEPGPGRRIRVAITSDGAFVIATTYPAKVEVEKARKEKKLAELPKAGLVIVESATGATTRIPGVKSLQVPSRGGAWLAYLKEARPQDKEPEKPKATAENAAAAAAEKPAAAAEKPSANPGSQPRGRRPGRTHGTELVLRDLARGKEQTIAHVLDYSFARDGKTLVYTVGSPKEPDNGIYAVAPGAGKPATTVLAGKGKYSRLTWDRAQSQLAFVSDRDDAQAKQPKLKTYLWPRGAAAAVEAVTQSTTGFPAKMVVSDKAGLGFTRDGKRLFVAAAPPPKPDKDKDKDKEDDKDKDKEKAGDKEAESDRAQPTDTVKADLWHWKDDIMQPMQRVRANQERNRTYRGIYHIAEKKYVQLAEGDAAHRHLHRRRPARHRPGRSRLPAHGRLRRQLQRRLPPGRGQRRAQAGHQAAARGRAAVVTRRQTRLLLPEPALARAGGRRGHPGAAQPDREAAGLVQQRAPRHSRPARQLRQRRLGEGQPLVPGPRPLRRLAAPRRRPRRPQPDRRPGAQGPPGVPGRADRATRGGRRRARHRPRPAAHPAGRAARRRAPAAFTGIRWPASAPPQRLLWGDRRYAYVGRALRRGRAAGVGLALRRVPGSAHHRLLLRAAPAGDQRRRPARGLPLGQRRADPLQERRRRTAAGRPCTSRRASTRARSTRCCSTSTSGCRRTCTTSARPGRAPASTSRITSATATWCSPRTSSTRSGSPGPSALKCVLPAIQAVVDRGFVDEKAIGIQGHSWGGYQIAYMVTQTNRFRAAAAGAPVGNMTSAYSGIRWGTGLPRQWQYEQAQSRMAKLLYEAPLGTWRTRRCSTSRTCRRRF